MQTSQKAQEARPIIKASLPPNISAIDKTKLENEWNEKALKRTEAIAHETRVPLESSVTLKFELRRFGKHWNAYAKNEKGKMIPLLATPSLLTSAIDLLTDKMSDQALEQ